MAAARSSDDPMDLGGFMQNFVLSNPFKDMNVIAGDGAPHDADAKDSASAAGSDKAANSAGSSPGPGGGGGGVKGAPHDADRAFVLAVDGGQVLDTPKAHVGSNVVFATALKLQKVSGAHAKVQKWLKNNYLHEPSYPLCKDARELVAEVQEHFPHVTNMTLSKIMTFTFPNAVKVTNISGFHGYKGLVGKPQPEDYCNLDLLKAVSHCKLYASISEAAQLYNVSASSVASLHYWHPDLASLPVHLSLADELTKNDSWTCAHSSAPTHHRKPLSVLKPGCVLPVEYCDPDSQTDLDGEQWSRAEARCARRSLSNSELPFIKIAPQERLEDDGQSEVSSAGINEEGGMAYSLLRNLLKRPRLEKCDGKPSERDGRCDDGIPDLADEVAVKSEPASSGYGDCAVDGAQSAAMAEERSDSRDGFAERPNGLHPNKVVTSSEGSPPAGCSDVAELRAEVQRLRRHVGQQISKNRKQEVQLLLSQREVLSLKSALCTQEVTIAELSQDFDSLHQQFSALRHKFKRALDRLDKKHSQPPKKKLSIKADVNGDKT